MWSISFFLMHLVSSGPSFSSNDEVLFMLLAKRKYWVLSIEATGEWWVFICSFGHKICSCHSPLAHSFCCYGSPPLEIIQNKRWTFKVDKQWLPHQFWGAMEITCNHCKRTFLTTHYHRYNPFIIKRKHSCIAVLKLTNYSWIKPKGNTWKLTMKVFLCTTQIVAGLPAFTDSPWHSTTTSEQF